MFGIAAYSIARVAEKRWTTSRAAAEFMEEELLSARTFKVVAKRSDKSFELKSPKSAILPAGTAWAVPHLKVDVHDPETLVVIEIRDFGAYIHSRQHTGAGGMPVGSGGERRCLFQAGLTPRWRVYDGKTRAFADRNSFCFPALYQRARRAESHIADGKLSQYAGRWIAAGSVYPHSA